MKKDKAQDDFLSQPKTEIGDKDDVKQTEDSTQTLVTKDSIKIEKTNSRVTDKIRENPWILATIVLGVITVFLLIGNFSDNNVTGSAVAVSPQEAESKVLEFINSQLDAPVEAVKTITKSGLYEVTVLFEGREVPVYITQDGENLVQGLAPIDELMRLASQQTNTQAEDNSFDSNIEISLDDDAVKGNANAPVTIVEFSDFQCPFCAKFYEETYPLLVNQYINTGKVKLVFRDFPLTSIHLDALKAAEAAECARLQGGDVTYFKYHDKLFENQEALDVESLKSYARQLGLKTADFNTCLDSGNMEAEVKADLQDGANYGVTGTPAFFINGRLLSGAYPFEEFKKIIDEELGITNTTINTTSVQ